MSTRSRGFTLIEALVALVLLSLGLLGAGGMLLGSLQSHADALHEMAAAQLVRDMADRIRANPRARAVYDSRSAPPVVVDCAGPSGCDATQLAALDRAHFESAARSLFAHQEYTASVEFAPAIGPAVPDRYVISLRWRDAAEETDAVAIQVLAQLPVAG